MTGRRIVAVAAPAPKPVKKRPLKICAMGDTWKLKRAQDTVREMSRDSLDCSAGTIVRGRLGKIHAGGGELESF
jgi:hypothetical protein